LGEQINQHQKKNQRHSVGYRPSRPQAYRRVNDFSAGGAKIERLLIGEAKIGEKVKTIKFKV